MLDTSVNAVWVGRELGEVALAALTNANILWMLLFAAAFGISMAATVRTAEHLGGGDLGRAKQVLGTTVTLSGIAAVLLSASVMTFAMPILWVLGTPTAAMRDAVVYLRLLMLSVPFSYLSASIMAVLRGAGDSRTGLYFSGLSIAIDVVLNPMLILGEGPLPRLGIAGSALATVASQAIALVAIIGYLYGRRNALCLWGGELALLRLRRAVAARLLCQGGPMALQFLWSSIEGVVMISLVNRLGTAVTAAYGAAIQLWSYIMMPSAACSSAATSLAAHKIGGQQRQGVQDVMRAAILYGMLATSLLVALIEMLGQRAFGLFLTAGSPALAFASQINKEATWSLVLYAGYSIWVGVMRATGAVWMPLMISGSVLGVRFAITGALLNRWHAQAIWWSFPVSAAVTGMLAVLAHRARRPPTVHPRDVNLPEAKL